MGGTLLRAAGDLFLYVPVDEGDFYMVVEMTPAYIQGLLDMAEGASAVDGHPRWYKGHPKGWTYKWGTRIRKHGPQGMRELRRWGAQVQITPTGIMWSWRKGTATSAEIPRSILEDVLAGRARGGQGAFIIATSGQQTVFFTGFNTLGRVKWMAQDFANTSGEEVLIEEIGATELSCVAPRRPKGTYTIWEADYRGVFLKGGVALGDLRTASQEAARLAEIHGGTELYLGVPRRCQTPLGTFQRGGLSGRGAVVDLTDPQRIEQVAREILEDGSPAEISAPALVDLLLCSEESAHAIAEAIARLLPGESHGV